MLSIGLTAVAVDLDHLAKVVLPDFSTVKFLLDVVKKNSSLFHLLLSCLFSWKGQASSLRVNYLSKLFGILLQRFVYSLLFILFIKIFLILFYF